MARLRKKRQRSHTLPEITLTPLIDTALTLLVIFMVTAPMINNSIKIDLPQGNQQEEEQKPQQKITVYLDKESNISLTTTVAGKNITTIKDKPALVSALQKLIGKEKNKHVYVEADQKVSYGKVYDLVDYIKDVGGISHVVLAATKRA